jgi:predicted lysophospholipase L1 biosynthesis ABC-type transport system permease subunit
MTDVSLREHLEMRLASLRDYIDTRLLDEQRAKDLALHDVDAKFAKVNELREQVLQERGMYPRIEIVDTLRDRVARLERLIPIVGLGSAMVGAIATTVAMKLFGIVAR